MKQPKDPSTWTKQQWQEYLNSLDRSTVRWQWGTYAGMVLLALVMLWSQGMTSLVWLWPLVVILYLFNGERTASAAYQAGFRAGAFAMAKDLRPDDVDMYRVVTLWTSKQANPPVQYRHPWQRNDN